MRRILVLPLLLFTGCATVPASYVKRVEKLEREVQSLREETRRLKEEAKRLRESLRQTEKYEAEIREAVNEEYREKGSMIRPPKAK